MFLSHLGIIGRFIDGIRLDVRRQLVFLGWSAGLLRRISLGVVIITEPCGIVKVRRQVARMLTVIFGRSVPQILQVVLAAARLALIKGGFHDNRMSLLRTFVGILRDERSVRHRRRRRHCGRGQGHHEVTFGS